MQMYQAASKCTLYFASVLEDVKDKPMGGIVNLIIETNYLIKYCITLVQIVLWS